MIDASAAMLENVSKISQTNKPRLADKSSANDSKEFLGYMDKSAEKNSSKVEENSGSLDRQSSSDTDNAEETDQQSSDGTPVATTVIDKTDPAREKIANLLMQRANILAKVTAETELSQKQLAAVEKVLDLDQISDNLLNKFIEKLNLDKSKGEQFHSRLMAEKNLTNLDVADAAASRLATEGADKNGLLNSMNTADRLNALTSLQQMKMSTPINSPDWDVEFGKRIQMLFKNSIQHAEIRLDPPELGRIQIRLNINQDQANISFSALNVNVREAIEGSMNRLREMLSEAGLQLGEANVGSEFQQQTHHRPEEPVQFADRNSNNLAGEDDESGELPAAMLQRSVDGVIDYFA